MPAKLIKEEFIEKAKKIHGNKYDYSKVEYVNNRTKVCIICPIHGGFWQIPDSHLSGKECKLCGTHVAKMKNRMKQHEFIEKATIAHNGKYDYSEVKYENTDTKVKIICPEHGEFWQTPHHHLNGIGCPKCGANNISENKLFTILKENFKDAIQQYSPPFLKENGHKQFIDIFIPSKNVGIEYQGRQHFTAISKFGGKKEFELTKQRDEKKYLKSKENGMLDTIPSYESKTYEITYKILDGADEIAAYKQEIEKLK